MATTTYHLNKVISSRYIKEEDIIDFFKTIQATNKLGLTVHPKVTIFKSDSKVKRSLDVLLDIGVDIPNLRKLVSGSTLYTFTIFDNNYYTPILEIPIASTRSDYLSREDSNKLFSAISDFIINNVDSHVELRCIKR